MRQPYIAAFFASIILLTPCAMAEGERRPTCAVLTIDALTGVDAGQAALLSDRLSAEISRIGKYRMVARQQMREILSIQAEGMTDVCASSSCAVELGRILAVQYVVYGTIGRLGSLYTINTVLIDVETAQIIKTATTDHQGGIETFLTEALAKNAHHLLEADYSPPQRQRQPQHVAPQESTPAPIVVRPPREAVEKNPATAPERKPRTPRTRIRSH